jgi:hypothetical protein
MNKKSNKINKTIHVPPGARSALLETCAGLGGAELEQVIAAALWSFARYEEEAKRRVIGDFWFNGRGGELAEQSHTGGGYSVSWQAVWLDKSVATLVGRGGVKPFSNAQTLVAILDGFARLPPDVREAMVGEYMGQAASRTAPALQPR